MFDLQQSVTSAVEAYRVLTGISLTSLANQLGISRPALSNRLRGVRAWQSPDLAALHTLGIIHISVEIDYGYNE